MPMPLSKEELRGVLKSTLNAIEAAAEATAQAGPPIVKVKDLPEIIKVKDALTQAIMVLDIPGGPSSPSG